MKKLGWQKILIIVTCAVVIFGMGSTAITNVKGLFNKSETNTQTQQQNNSTENASVEFGYVL